MSVFLTLIGYTLVVLMDQVQLYKDGRKKDFYVSSAMGLFSFTIAILLALDVKIPSPALPMKYLILMVLRQGGLL